MKMRTCSHIQVIQGAQDRPTYSEAAGDHTLISTVKPRGLHGPARLSGSSLSPLRGAAADPQRKLDAVVQRIDANRGIYEQCVLETSKAGELVKTLEAELR